MFSISEKTYERTFPLTQRTWTWAQLFKVLFISVYKIESQLKITLFYLLTKPMIKIGLAV